jgi:hypothetical protein
LNGVGHTSSRDVVRRLREYLFGWCSVWGTVKRAAHSDGEKVGRVKMPYQVLPGLAVISLAFTVMGIGFGAVNKREFRHEHQVRVYIRFRGVMMPNKSLNDGFIMRI